jgi:hypothetical protein
MTAQAYAKADYLLAHERLGSIRSTEHSIGRPAFEAASESGSSFVSPSHDGNHRVFSFKNKPSLVFNPNHLLMRAPKAYSQRLVSCMYMHI